ncbi:hypothetical protein HDU67_005979 [Dinochytrium kinnereticum]|nr:hypothetical protein HDU67_005979 [Dinochytrium kinnereticum]
MAELASPRPQSPSSVIRQSLPTLVDAAAASCSSAPRAHAMAGVGAESTTDDAHSWMDDDYDHDHDHDDDDDKELRNGNEDGMRPPMAPAAGPAFAHVPLLNDHKKKEPGARGTHRPKDPWAYRSYQPTLPCANKLLQKKWDSVAQRDHALKVKNAAATVDTAPPKKYSHLVSQTRKMRTTAELAAKLHAENKNLLRRIKRQINSAPMNGLFPSPGIKSAAPSGDPVAHVYGVNGPRNRRLREQTKKENELILQRLEASEPHYSQEDFERDRLHTLLYLQNISRFPARYKKELETLGSPARSTTPSTFTTDYPSVRPKSAPTPSISSSISAPRPPPHSHAVKPVTSTNSIEIPKRWAPRSPIVPRVARLRPRSAPAPETPKEPEKPKITAPLVPRVAYLAKKPEPKKEPVKLRPERPEEVPGHYAFEDSFPGDDEMYLTGDGFSLMNASAMAASGKQPSSSRHSDSDETNRGLITGVPGFSSSFALPEPASTSVKVYLSSLPDEMTVERERFYETAVPMIREACFAMGLEFRMVDMKWGAQEMWFEPAQWSKLCLWELEKDIKESMSVNAIVFFGKTSYGSRCLPFEMDESIFQRILKQARRLEESSHFKSDDFTWSVNLLERWYELDETFVPPKRVLRPLAEMVTEFGDPDTKMTAWNFYWQGLYYPALQNVLRASVVYLGRKGIMDPASVQKMVQSTFQEEIVRGILKQSRRGSWERGILVTNPLEIGEAPLAIDQKNSEADLHAAEEHAKKVKNEARLLGELWNNLFAAVPYENRILKKVDIEDQEESIQGVVDELSDAVKRLITRSLSFRSKPNTLVEEIMVHNAQFRQKARDHIRRQHLIDKVINFMSRPDAWPLPPFLLYGEGSMGRTSLLGKALQKFVQKALDTTWCINHYGNAGSGISRGESPLPPFSSQIEKSASIGASLSTPSLAMQANFRRRKSVASIIRPVAIARIAGLTPESSSPAGLMSSLTRQICAAYNVAVDDNDEINVEVFREALRLASAERPLIIVIAKVDRLPCTGPTTLRLSWLIDSIPPYVRIVLSTREEKKKWGAFGFIQERITLAIPGLLSAAAKASGLPQLDSDASNMTEQFMLRTGELILPVVKASIKKWMDCDGRKLKQEQIDAITKAYQSSSPTDSGALCIRMLKKLYNISKKWKSSDPSVSAVFPKTLSEAFQNVLKGWEETNGKVFTKAAMSLLMLSRDGLTHSELEDLLSLDDDVLLECYQLVETPRMRIPPYYLTRFLATISESVVRRSSWGGELLSFPADLDLKSAAQERYLDEIGRGKYLELLSQYFLGTFYEGKPFFRPSVGGELVPLFTERNILPMPTRLPLAPCGLEAKSEGLWNVRKIRELPRLLAKVGAWKVLAMLFEDLDMLYGFRESLSTPRAIEDVYHLLCIGSREGSLEFELVASKLESLFDFLTWIRYFLSITPVSLQRMVVYEQLLRLPPSLSPVKTEDGLAKALSFSRWSGFERMEKSGLGPFQCDPMWYPELRCPNSSQRSLSEDNMRFPESHISPHLKPSLSHDARFKFMIQSTRDCNFYGHKDEGAVWRRPCLRPYTSFLHRRHVLLTASPDGRYLASLCANGNVKVYDSTTYTELWTFTSTGRVTAFSFQPDSKNCEYLLTAGSGGVTRWSLKKGLSTCTIVGKKNGISSNAVSCGFVADNRERTYCRAYALFVTGYLVIWDLETGGVLKSMAPDEDDDEFFSYGSACVSNNGRYLLFGSRMIKIYQCSSLVSFWSQQLFNRKAVDLRMHRITHLRFSDDNSSFYVVSNFGNKDNELPDPKAEVEWRGIVQRWEFQSKSSRILSRLGTRATSISVSSDNRLLAIGSEDGNVDILNAFSGTRIATEAFAHTISSVVFMTEHCDLTPKESDNIESYYYKRRSSWIGVGSEELIDSARLTGSSMPTTYRLCTGSIDGMIRILGIQSDPEGCPRSPISAARLSHDGKYVILAGGGESDNLNALPSCFMHGPRSESKADSFRNRLASTAIMHHQESLELINDLVLGASTMRTKSEMAWEASSVSLTAGPRQGRSMSTVSTKEDLEKMKRSKSAINSVASTKPSSPIPQDDDLPVAHLGVSKDDKVSSQLSMYDLNMRPVETTLVSLYDVGSARQICSFTTRGDIIWCDFERDTDGSIRAIVTGDRSGTVRFWCVGPHLNGEDGLIRGLENTLLDVQVEVFEMKVVDGPTTDLVVGYSLNRANSTLAVALTFDPIDVKNLPEGANIDSQTTTGLITMVDFWDFDTGQKIDHLSTSVDALPCIIGSQANPLLSLSWSLPSEDITRFHSVHFDNNVVSQPSALGIGPTRLFIRTDMDTQTSLPVTKIIEHCVGSDAAARCTASCQSRHDPRVILVAFGDVICWICEERFPVVKIPQEIEGGGSGEKKERGSKVERDSRSEKGEAGQVGVEKERRKSEKNEETVQANENIKTLADVVPNGGMEVALNEVAMVDGADAIENTGIGRIAGDAEIAITKAEIIDGAVKEETTIQIGLPTELTQNFIIEPTPNGEDVANPDPITLPPSANPLSLLEAQSPTDYCRIRRIVSPHGESVIGLHHLKGKKVDAVLAATDAGTLTVYDLTLPAQWSGIEFVNTQEIQEDCTVVAIWHARTPLLGMQVVEVESIGHGNLDGEKGRWKVVVWGRNGFSAVLSLQL